MSDKAQYGSQTSRAPSTLTHNSDLESLIFEDVEGDGPPLYEESLGSESSFSAGQPEQNARFGRWAGWVEKRALERLDDPARHARRAARRELPGYPRPPSYAASVSTVLDNRKDTSEQEPKRDVDLRQLKQLTSTLWREDFGSRFIPHSTDRITCALPLFGGRLIVLGTVRGLVVLNSDDSPARRIWTGLPVWDIQVLKSFVDGDRTPRGSVLVLCGGSEDPKRPGTPLKKDLEARVWKLGGLASLARWSATLYPEWEGLNLDRKGKEKLVLASVGGYVHPTLRVPGSVEPPSESEMEFAKAWAAEFITLRPNLDGKTAAIHAIASKLRGAEIFVALSTSNSVILYTGACTETGFSFRPCRQFYLPFPPANLALVDLAGKGEGDLPILGVAVSFGSKQCIIRSGDSAVVDFKPPGKGKGDWAATQTVHVRGQEMYLFTRGKETMIYPSPLRLPISVPPIVNTIWPEAPTSLLTMATPTSVLLITTNTSELRIQEAVATAGPLGLLAQENALLRGSLLPIAWSEDPSVHVILENGLRIARLEQI